jgi:hypothetical protein
MSSIRVGNNGAEIVNVEKVCALLLGDTETLLSLLSVVEELGHEEMGDFVGNGGLDACQTN